jgi:hypothetical protein
MTKPSEPQPSDNPGTAPRVPVPHEEAAPETSEEFRCVDGVNTYPAESEEPDEGALGRIG